MATWTANRTYAFIIGVIFVIIGIVGFFFSSTMSMGNMFGFHVDLVHNLIHLVTGLVALAAVFTGYSRLFNRVFGIVYLVLGIAGLIPALYFNGLLLGITHVNAVDHVLHLVVGVLGVALGFFVSDSFTFSSTKSATPAA